MAISVYTCSLAGVRVIAHVCVVVLDDDPGCLLCGLGAKSAHRGRSLMKEQYGYFNDVNSSYPRTQNMLPFISIFFDFFLQSLIIF